MVRLVHLPADHFIPHQVHALDGLYLAGFPTKGAALGWISGKGWKVAP